MVGPFRIVVSQNAKIKLKEIYNYTKENISSELAEKLRDGLLEEAEKLQKRPESKPLLRMKKQVVPPYRYSKKWSYKIIFQFFENENLISIIDFMHDRENPEKKEHL